MGSLFSCSLSPLAAVTLEYVAHACFVVESSSGERIVIDPFNSNRWLGYSFPNGLKADAVAVTHAHYDHNAAYYIPRAPVFRKPGEYAVGGLRLTGVPGKHAEPYGKEFGQANTLWVIEADGVRIAHLGDTGPLDAEMIRGLGRVDVLLLPVDGDEHILKFPEVAAIIESLRPKITIPMHYRLTGLTELPASLGPIDPWLKSRPEALRLSSHRVALTPEKLAKDGQIWVLPPSPDVKPWGPRMREADRLRLAARKAPEKEAIKQLRQAAALAPGAMRPSLELARKLDGARQSEEAATVLREALSRSAQMDYEFRVLARDLLAQIYERRGDTALAAIQYRIILAESDWLDPLRRAREFLAAHPANR